MNSNNAESKLWLVFNGLALRPAPVWIMRQAGRYLPDYMELKKRYSFETMSTEPDLIHKITLMPLRYFGLDCAIIFSDILTPLRLLGLDVKFNPQPEISHHLVLNREYQKPISSYLELRQLASNYAKADISRDLGFVLEAIKSLKAELAEKSWFLDNSPRELLGFVGAPFTLLHYLLHNPYSKQLDIPSLLANSDPDSFCSALKLLTGLLKDYIQAQVEAGIRVIQLFDTWAGNMTEEIFSEVYWPYMAELVEFIRTLGAKSIIYTGNAGHLIPSFIKLNPDCLSLDHRISLRQTDSLAPNKIALQGNFPPSGLFATSDKLRNNANKMLGAVSPQRPYIVNLGHGIYPNTPPGKVTEFISYVRNAS